MAAPPITETRSIAATRFCSQTCSQWRRILAPSANLLHRRSPFHCASSTSKYWERIGSRGRPAFSSHLNGQRRSAAALLQTGVKSQWRVSFRLGDDSPRSVVSIARRSIANPGCRSTVRPLHMQMRALVYRETDKWRGRHSIDYLSIKSAYGGMPTRRSRSMKRGSERRGSQRASTLR